MPPRPETRDNWPLIIAALILFWPVGVVLLITKPQRAVKPAQPDPASLKRAPVEYNQTDREIAACKAFYALAIVGGIIFAIGVITGAGFALGAGFLIGVPSWGIAYGLADQVNRKRQDYYYYRHYRNWK